jgi:O-antigen/teichoic acid export membrane protein
MSFTKSSIATFITLTVAAALGLIWNIVIGRVLGPQGMGVIAVITTYSVLLYTIGNLTFGISTVYVIGSRKHPIDSVVTNSLLVGVIAGTVLYLIAIITIPMARDTLYKGIDTVYLYIAFTTTVFNLLVYQMMSVLQGLNLIGKYNLAYMSRCTSALLFLAIILVLANHGKISLADHGIILITIAISASFAVTAALSIYYVLKQTTLKWKVDLTLLKNTIVSSGKLHIATIATFIYGQAGILIANYYLAPYDVGYLYLAMVFTQFILFVPQAICVVLYPKVAVVTEKNAEELSTMICRNTVFLVMIMSVILAALSTIIVKILLGGSFQTVVPLLLLLLPGMVLFAVAQVLSALWIRKGWLWQMAVSGVFVAIVGVSTQLLMIPKYGITGAAIASSITYSVGFVIVTTMHFIYIDKKIWKLLVIQPSDIKEYRKLWTEIKGLIHA